MKNTLTIGWLYPTLMSTYGDRGNITVLQKRCEWREIDTEIRRLEPGFKTQDLSQCDLLFMGGAQDRQQKIVATDLKEKKDVLSEMIENNIPGLYICGAYQFLGKYYKEPDGTIIEGMGIFDLFTESPKNKPRLIGNIVCSMDSQNILVGFENHGGRTYLGKNLKPLGIVKVGFGNNGEDKTEGAIYKNSFGSYLHGPILPKNPNLADLLIKCALEQKHKDKVLLKELNDSLEEQARDTILDRLLK